MMSVRCTDRLFLLLLSVCTAPLGAIDPPASVKSIPGVLDLSTGSLDREEIIDLSGEWLIFWDQLLPPESVSGISRDELVAGSDGAFSMPHTWNDWEYRGDPVGGLGYATFVVDVVLPRGMERAALWIPNASTAYTLWVDGRPVASSGVPGRTRSESRPHYVMRTAQFPVDGDTVRLVLHVSNFHHRRGGMWKPIRLGTPERITLLDTHETAYDLLLLGSFFALGLYNLFLFVGARERRNSTSRGIAVPLLLAIAFGALVVRVLVTGQILATRLNPGFPWSLQLRLEYLSAMVVLLSFAWICDRAYPGVIPRWVIRFVTVFVAVNATIALLFPVIVYSRVVTSYNIIKSITLLGMTIRFIQWALKGNRESWAMVGAIVIFFLITFGETLHYREVVLSRDFAPVGFIVSVLSGGGSPSPLVYLVSTMGTLGVILVVFNLFVLRISLAFLKHEERLTPLDLTKLSAEFGITVREKEILQRVAVGRSNKQIAAELFISEGTVKNHLYRIMRKLNVGNRTEIAVRLTGYALPPLSGADG